MTNIFPEFILPYYVAMDFQSNYNLPTYCYVYPITHIPITTYVASHWLSNLPPNTVRSCLVCLEAEGRWASPSPTSHTSSPLLTPAHEEHSGTEL